MDTLEREAADYLAKHRINELWVHLGSVLALRKPDNVPEFLIKELQRRIFEGGEFQAIFASVDVNRAGFIGSEQARVAMRSLALSKKQEEDISRLSLGDTVSEYACTSIFFHLPLVRPEFTTLCKRVFSF